MGLERCNPSGNDQITPSGYRKPSRIMLRLAPELHLEFKRKVEDANVSMNKILIGLIENYLEAGKEPTKDAESAVGEETQEAGEETQAETRQDETGLREEVQSP